MNLCQRFLFERNFSSKKLISVFKRTFFFSFSLSCLWVLRIFFKTLQYLVRAFHRKDECVQFIIKVSGLQVPIPCVCRPLPPPASFSQPHVDFCPGHFSFPYKQQVQFINSTKTCQSAAAPFPRPVRADERPSERLRTC